MSIGKKIKRLRKRLGLSQEAFAKKLHVKVVTVSRWENEQTFPRQKSRNKLERMALDAKG